MENIRAQYAYATFLAAPSAPDQGPMERDPFFVAMRILTYQLLHAPETRTQQDYPLIILVTSNVTEAKRDRLRRDGAIIWEALPLDTGWVKTEVVTWQDVMSKLRLWELTQFERICFMDGDTVLTAPLDEIFHDQAVASSKTGAQTKAIVNDEAPLPTEYVFAGVAEMKRFHHYPPSEEGGDWPNINYLNAGFFVMKPSLEMLNFYTTLMRISVRFDPYFPEQNLLNYAHRREGNMPWRQLDTKWNIHYPSLEDLKGGVASLHEKWWAPVNVDLKPFLESWRWRMEGYWEAREGLCLLRSH
ncbi:glycosyltransferase family 8 protein [Acidomyces richmondensis BFW]|nr:glycosyltransferase family 8 protein [Acidomyces richmondensis BFW]